MVLQFSTAHDIPRVCGKLSNQSKIAPGGLSKRENILFFRNLVFAKLEQLGFSLNIAVVMHPNGPKYLRNEEILSLISLDTLWVLKNMVWSHYFAVLTLFMAAEVA